MIITVHASGTEFLLQDGNMRALWSVAAAVVTCLILPSLSHGQSFTWTAAGFGLWNNNASWNPNTGFPNSATAEAIFNSSSSGAFVNISSGVTVNRLTFDSIGAGIAYQFSGSSITLGGANAVVQTSNNTSTLEQEVHVDLLGSGNVVHNSGLLWLDGSGSAFTGAVTVNGGRLRIAPPDSTVRPLGAAGNAVTVNTGGQLAVSAAGTNGVSMPYALTLNGNGEVGAPANETGALAFGAQSKVSWNGLITLGSNASIRWAGISGLTGGVDLGSNTLTFVGISSETGGISSTAITGSGNVIFQGNTQISVNSTYTGSSTIDGATVTLVGVPNGLGQSLGTTANKVTIQPNSTLRLQSSSNFNVGNKLLTLAGGTLATTNATASWAGAIDLTAASEIRVEGPATLSVTGGVSNPNFLLTLNVTLNASRLNVNTTGISGNGGVTTAGLGGEVHLNATSSYTGQTNVPAAFLYADAATATGMGSVVVSGTGVLRGTGSIAGSVTVNGTGTLAPGATTTPGVLTANNAVTIASGADFASRLFSSTPGNVDSLAITASAFSFNGADLLLDATNFTGGIPGGTAFPLVVASGGATITAGQTFASLPEGAVATTVNGTNLFIHYSYGANGQIFLSTSAAVPEPTVLAFIVVTLAGVGYGATRRSRSATPITSKRTPGGEPCTE